jgi:hypothetical protein
MKFVKTLVTAALVSLVATQSSGKDSGTTYESKEKEEFIYGRPGSEGYGETKTAAEIMELEQMWVLDLNAQKYRGALQGFHRGLYHDYDWELQRNCLSRQTVKQAYYVQEISSTFDFAKVIDLLGLFYNLYYNIDAQCTVENTLYDLSWFCFDHDCGGEKLLQNELSKVFQVTGALNSLAAIYYDE